MEEYSRRELAMMSTSEIKEKYVTGVRLGIQENDLKKELEDRGIDVPDGSNPKSLL